MPPRHPMVPPPLLCSTLPRMPPPPHRRPVLLLGEPGLSKGGLAARIHYSADASRELPLVQIGAHGTPVCIHGHRRRFVWLTVDAAHACGWCSTCPGCVAPSPPAISTDLQLCCPAPALPQTAATGRPLPPSACCLARQAMAVCWGA